MVSVALADDDGWGDISDQDWAVQAPEDYPEANAVIILDKCHTEIGLEQIKMEHYVRIKVLTEAGIDEVGDRTITYREKDKIKHFDARTILPGGDKKDVKGDAVHEKELTGYKQQTFSFPALQPGCIVEYKYTILTKSFYHPQSWFFQNSLYTLKSIYSAKIGQGFAYDISYQNVPLMNREPEIEERPDPNYSVTKGAKIKTYTWTMENIPPVKDEPYMSAEDDYRSSLRFQLASFENQYNNISFSRDWTELGKEWSDELDDYCNKDGEVKKLAQQITANLTSDRDKSQALYEYVAGEFATTDGLTFFEHEKMSEMLQEKRGKGPEKNLLLAKLHQALGIPSWPVMISTRDNAKFNPRFPDLRQFNYMIAFVQLGDQWEFLDAANKYSPYGILPSRCLTDGGFLVDGEKSQLVRMTIKPTVSARIDRTRMYVNPDGTVACSTKVDLCGYSASSFGQEYAQTEEEEFVKDHFLDRLEVGCEPGVHHCSMDSLNQLVMDLCYTSPELARKLDNNVVITPVSYAFRTNPFKSEKRFFPVDFTYPFQYSNIVEVHVDGDPADYILPENLDYEIGGASYTRSSEVTDSAIVIVSKLSIENPEFPPVRYPALRDFFQKVAESAHDPLTVVLQQ
jgi:transglutaminase-like putative cysteine protease